MKNTQSTACVLQISLVLSNARRFLLQYHIHMNSTSLFVSYWSFQVINSLMRKYMSLELLVCSKNFLNESFTKHTVCIQFYLQHSLQLPWASYVSVSRRRHISMYVFLPSSLSDFVSSALRKMKKKIVIVYLWFPCSLLISKFCDNCVAKIVL